MSLPFDIPDIERELRGLLAQIPAGKVATCGMLAEALGSSMAARWIGWFALHHRHDDACPCHRIVRAGGELGAYVTGDLKEKIRQLKKEGVAIRGGVVDLALHGDVRFVGDRPLEKLREIQEELARKIALRPRKRLPKFVGSVDVAYPAAEQAAAAYALVETATGDLVFTHVIRREIRFPYITSFLSFRELPILLDLLAEVRAAGKMAEVLLVDGSGILHPRRAGIASHLGVAADVPTIGVTKKLLCGEVDIEDIQPLESRPVRFEDRLLGAAIRPTAGSLRPIFVSPGHRLDLPFALQVVVQLLRGHRLPEPIYWADRFSKKKFEDGDEIEGEFKLRNDE